MKEDALKTVDAFLARNPNNSAHFLCLQRDKVGADLRDRIDTPGLIRQGPAGLCGPASLLFDLASSRPEAYASFGIDLFERGVARIGKLEVKPSKALKIAACPISMDQADWMMMASIRNSENSIFCDYDAPSGNWNQFKGMTMPGEMTSWLRKVGYARVAEETSISKIFSMSASNARDASAKFNDGWHVFLFINANMLNFHSEHVSGLTPDHWVMLRSAISLSERSVKLKIFTWGQGEFEVPTKQSVDPPTGMERQGNHDFTQEMFLKNYYGYIAARD